MDIKKIFNIMLIAGGLMLLYSFMTGGFGGAKKNEPAPHALYTMIPQEALAAEDKATEQTILLGGARPEDNSLLAVKINNRTAGIDSVQFNAREYAATYDRTEPLTLFQADPKLAKPFSTLGIHISLGDSAKELFGGKIRLKMSDGTYVTRDVTQEDSAEIIATANASNILTSGYIWKIEDKLATATDVVLSASFQFDGKPVAKIYKRFHLDPKSYDLTITHTVENLSPGKIRVRIDQLAAPALLRDDPQGDDRFFFSTALNSAKQYVDSSYNMAWGGIRGAVGEGGTDTVGGAQGQFFDFANNAQLWVASSNRFFAAIVRPLPETGNVGAFKLATGQSLAQPGHVASAHLDLMRKDGSNAEYDAAIIRLSGRMLEVPPGQKIEEPLSVFLGPKNRGILEGNVAVGGKPEYKTYNYIKLVQFNTCAAYPSCIIDPVAHAILWLLDFFKGNIAFGNYGVAIMILVLVVRAALHPLTRASQVNMAKMGKQMRDVQPQMEAMKKKYADNKKKQSEEMMRIYRENKINPAGGIMGCLPMLIQMPIWVALYSGLRTDIDLRHAAFIPGWINDLASPDKLIPSGALVLGHPLTTIPLIGEIYGFNLLPILLAGVFFFQMKVSMATQPKPADEQQAQMAKISQYMIFIFPLFLYNAPSGLNLYIFASTMGGLLDTYFVRKTLKKQGILAPTAPLLPTHAEADNKKK